MEALNLKIAVGGIGASFALGAVFWAGAAYNRISAIETKLNEISTKLPALERVAVIDDSMRRMQIQIDRIQDEFDRRNQSR